MTSKDSKEIKIKNEASSKSFARSNSASTIARIAQRYRRAQNIAIYEDGAELSDQTPCVIIELNSMLKKYCL